MAVVVPTRTYTTGDSLTASNYNADRNEIINGVNSVVDAQVAIGANISSAKISGVAVTLTSSRVITTIPDAATVNIDGTQGNTFEVTLGASRTLTASIASGQYVALFVTQGGTGSYTFTGTFFNTTVLWADGVVPTLTTTVGKTDVLVFVNKGGTYFGFVASQNM